MLDRTLTVILAGGVGSRLHPLTADRAKPAVPFGGKYRILDFTLSNCLHSGLRRVLVLTQYKSHSLQKHLRDGWSIYNPGIGEYITLIPPQMRTGESWYAGTADAVYQNLYLLERSGADQVLVLSGDHIYRMDYAAMLQFHCNSLADVTLACMPVPRKEGTAFGITAVDDENRITSFLEKPANPPCMPGDPTRSLASMGIYVFSRELLCELLREDHERPDSAHDFGRNILPRILDTHAVYGYQFGGKSGRVSADRYWRDVGTLDAYYEANMDLLRPDPPMDLYQRDWGIHTALTQGPPARTVPGPSGQRAEIDNAILAAGSVVRGGTVAQSILSQGVVVDDGAKVEDSILFEGVEVGPGAYLRKCIVDKHVKIPPDVRIGADFDDSPPEFTVSEEGVTVIPRGFRFQAATTQRPAAESVPSTR
jgi:glucose-1-phosphate adenylyltransferase